MIKLDKSYSDYTDETDGKYPAGKGVNASSSESYDGTPWLADMMNDEHGARQAIYKAAYGSVDSLSGVPDNAEQSDTLNAIKKLIDDSDKAHADLRGTSAHGATVEASPGQLVTRDEYGRAQFSAPIAAMDVARKAEIDELEEKNALTYVLKTEKARLKKMRLSSGVNGCIVEEYDPETRIVVYFVNVSGDFKGLGSIIAYDFRLPENAAEGDDVLWTSIGFFSSGNSGGVTLGPVCGRVLVRGYDFPYLEFELNGGGFLTAVFAYKVKEDASNQNLT